MDLELNVVVKLGRWELPCTTRSVRLTFEHEGERHVVELALGTLRLPREHRGVVERLINLGVLGLTAVALDASHPLIEWALRAYQGKRGLEETGQPDSATCAALASDAGG